jgi:hypothetical protein
VRKHLAEVIDLVKNSSKLLQTHKVNFVMKEDQKVVTGQDLNIRV